MRYKPILMNKINAEKKKENRKTPIEAVKNVVKEKGMTGILLTAGREVLQLVFIGFMFIGLVTLLNPESQMILLSFIGR